MSDGRGGRHSSRKLRPRHTDTCRQWKLPDSAETHQSTRTLPKPDTMQKHTRSSPKLRFTPRHPGTPSPSYIHLHTQTCTPNRSRPCTRTLAPRPQTDTQTSVSAQETDRHQSPHPTSPATHSPQKYVNKHSSVTQINPKPQTRPLMQTQPCSSTDPRQACRPTLSTHGRSQVCSWK